MRYATIEYRLVAGGPRRIDRFEFRNNGDYSDQLPAKAEVVNVWVPSKGKTNEEDL